MSEMSQSDDRESPDAKIVQFPIEVSMGPDIDPTGAPESAPDQLLDAGELFKEENIEWFLTELAHPSRRNQDPAALAEYALRYLKPFLSQDEQAALTPQDIDRRKALIGACVETILMPEEEIEVFKAQDGIYAALDVARTSLNKNDPGARERRQAMLALQELRMGIVVADIASDDTHWSEITRRLG